MTVLVLAAAVAVALLAAITPLVTRRPWLIAWLAVPVFATSSELQLRTAPAAGVLKDVVVVVVVAAAAWHVHRDRQLLRRLVAWRGPLLALGILLGLYVANPVGTHGAAWLLSVRLIVECVALLVAALVWPYPARTTTHLVRAVAVVAGAEAALAWLQQRAGEYALVHDWSYQFGAQVRLTSGGGLRTSGTFADPFQLAALAMIALCLGLFVARGWTAATLLGAAAAIAAATSVRTLALQAVLLTLLWLVSRGRRAAAAATGVALAAAGLLAGLTITTASRPGGPTTPLLLGLNGRFTAWSQAVQGELSLLIGNGVATVGAGSTRAASGVLSAAPTYDPTASPTAVFAGNSAFLDSAYAQVQADVGILGVLALAIWLIGTIVVLARRRTSAGPARWAALGLVLASALDWVGRTSLFSFSTGFLTLFVLGLLSARAAVAAPPRRPRWGRLDRPAAAGGGHRGAHRPKESPATTAIPAAGSRKLARLGVVAAVLSRTFGRIVGVLFVVVLARTSDDTTVAAYGYLLGTATLVVTLADLGVAAVAGREVAAGRLPARAALAAALPAQAVSVVAACGVTLALVALTRPAGVTAAPLALTLAFLLLNGMVNLWGELLRGRGQVLVEAALQILSAVLLVGGGLLVVGAGGGASALLAVVAGKELVVLALSWLLLRPRRQPEIVRPRQLVRHSVHLAVAGAAVIVVWRQGTVLVGAAGSVTALAAYIVASRFLDAAVTLANTIGFGLLPGAAAAAADPVALRAMARRYLTIVAVAGALAGVVGVLFAGPLTTGLFGQRWVEAVPAVRVMAVAVLPIFVGYVAWFVLLAAGELPWIAGSAVAAALAAIGASVVGTRLTSAVTAAALGTAAGAVVLAVALCHRLRRHLHRADGVPSVLPAPARPTTERAGFTSGRTAVLTDTRPIEG